MNNEPVAEKTSNNGWRVSKEYMDFPIGTLLYTHPAKEPTEYIKYRLAVKEFGESFCITYRTELLAYANSILRKAQERC